MTQALPQVGAPPAGATFPGTSPAAAAGPSVGAAPPALRPIVDRDKFNAAVAKVQTYAQENYGYAMPLTQAEALVQGDPNADLKMTVRVRTLKAQEQKHTQEMDEAGLTGTRNGQPTLEGRRVAALEEQNEIERERLAETARQFDSTELRIADQFAQTYGLSRDEFLEVVRANKAGETIEDARLKQAADQFSEDIALRRDTLSLSREQFEESTRQFNATFDEEAARFAQTFGLSKDQFLEVVRQYNSDRSQVRQEYVEGIRRFNQEMGLKKDELGLRREELEATREERQAAHARWEKEFDAQTDQFAKTFQLDEDTFEEGIRRFNTGQAFEDKKLEAQITQFYEELGVTKEDLQFRRDSFTLEYNQRAEQFAAEFGLTKEQFAENVRQFDAGNQLANRELETRISQFKDEMAERQENRLESMRQFNLTYGQRADEFAADLGMRKEVFLESVRQFNSGETLDYARLRVDQDSLDESIRQFNLKMDAAKDEQAWQDARDEKDYLRKIFLTELEGTLQAGQQQSEMDWKSVENYLQREHETDLQNTSLTAEQRRTKEEGRYAALGMAVRGLAHFLDQKYLSADQGQQFIAQIDALMGNTAGWTEKKYWEDLGYGAASKGMAEHFQKYPAPKTATVPTGATPPPAGGATPPPTGTTPADLGGQVGSTPTGAVDWNRLKGTLTPRNLLTFGLQAVTGAYTAQGNIAGMGSDPWISTVTDILGAGQAFVAGGGIAAAGAAANSAGAAAFNPAGLAGYMAGRLGYGMYQWYSGNRADQWNKIGFQLPGDVYARTLASPEIIEQMGGAEQFSGNRIVPFINFQTEEVVWDKSGGQAQIKEPLAAFVERNKALPISFYGAEDETWNSFPAELRQMLGFKPSYAVVNKDGSVLFLGAGSRQDRKSKVIEPADAQKYFSEYAQPETTIDGGTGARGENREQELRNQAKSVGGLSDVELDSIAAALPAARRTMLFNRLASGNVFTDVDEQGIFRDAGTGNPISASAWQAWTTLKDQKRIKFQTSAAVGG